MDPQQNPNPAETETSAPVDAPAPVAFDPKPIRRAAAKWKRVNDDNRRYPQLTIDCREEEQRLEAQLAKLGIDHLRPDAVPAGDDDNVSLMAGHLQTIRTKLRMIPISQKQNEAALAQLSGQIQQLAEVIINEQTAEARRRLKYARTELCRVLFDIYGKDPVKTARAADSLLGSHRLPMVNTIFPKPEPVRWLQFWQEAARATHPCDLADYVETLLDNVARFQAEGTVTGGAGQTGAELQSPM